MYSLLQQAEKIKELFINGNGAIDQEIWIFEDNEIVIKEMLSIMPKEKEVCFVIRITDEVRFDILSSHGAKILSCLFRKAYTPLLVRNLLHTAKTVSTRKNYV